MSTYFRSILAASGFCFICVMYSTRCLAVDDTALIQVIKQAQDGDVLAQFELAERHYEGDGLPRNYDEAYNWYLKAANQNHAEAQHKIGYFYKHGLGSIAKDETRAFQWYQRAARLGHTASQTQLSVMYSLGIGVAPDKAQSRYWSDQVLQKKGLLDTGPEPAIGTQQPAGGGAAEDGASLAPAPSAQFTAAVVTDSSVSRPSTSAVAAGKPVGLTPEQYKAWRREQARRLVEAANARAAEEGEWTE